MFLLNLCLCLLLLVIFVVCIIISFIFVCLCLVSSYLHVRKIWLKSFEFELINRRCRLIGRWPRTTRWPMSSVTWATFTARISEWWPVWGSRRTSVAIRSSLTTWKSIRATISTARSFQKSVMFPLGSIGSLSTILADAVSLDTVWVFVFNYNSFIWRFIWEICYCAENFHVIF